MSKQLKIILCVVLTLVVFCGAALYEGSRRMESGFQRASAAECNCQAALGDTATAEARRECGTARRFAENNQVGTLVESIPFALICTAILWVILGIGLFVLGRSRRGEDAPGA